MVAASNDTIEMTVFQPLDNQTVNGSVSFLNQTADFRFNWNDDVIINVTIRSTQPVPSAQSVAVTIAANIGVDTYRISVSKFVVGSNGTARVAVRFMDGNPSAVSLYKSFQHKVEILDFNCFAYFASAAASGQPRI